MHDPKVAEILPRHDVLRDEQIERTCQMIEAECDMIDDDHRDRALVNHVVARPRRRIIGM